MRKLIYAQKELEVAVVEKSSNVLRVKNDAIRFQTEVPDPYPHSNGGQQLGALEAWPFLLFHTLIIPIKIRSLLWTNQLLTFYQGVHITYFSLSMIKSSEILRTILCYFLSNSLNIFNNEFVNYCTCHHLHNRPNNKFLYCKKYCHLLYILTCKK